MGRIMAGQARDGRRVNPWRIAGWGLALALLATPLVAMQFTDEVRWGPLDFAVAGVLLVALIGALAARFRAKGMAAAMAVTAAAQLLAAGAAYFLTGEVRPIEIVLTAAFAAPWLGSALLFRLAAAQEAALRA